MKITDEMVTAGRATQVACRVEHVRSNGIVGYVPPTEWYYGTQIFPTFDAAKEAQQRDVVRAVLEAALGSCALVGEAGG